MKGLSATEQRIRLIAALAALGIGSVRVTAPIRVSLLTTGAELRSAFGAHRSRCPTLVPTFRNVTTERKSAF